MLSLHILVLVLSNVQSSVCVLANVGLFIPSRLLSTPTLPLQSCETFTAFVLFHHVD